jgi:hypothetical protein
MKVNFRPSTSGILTFRGLAWQRCGESRFVTSRSLNFNLACSSKIPLAQNGESSPSPESRRGDNLARRGTKPGYHFCMTDNQSRPVANSRERSPDHEYSLSIDQTSELYAAAGLPRTPRAIQKYCAVGKLDCHKVETEIGEKYLVAAYSVERHIAYIKEVRTDATSRDQTRTDANVRNMETKPEEPTPRPANGDEQSRIDATVRGVGDRYVGLLERENELLRGQLTAKDRTIEALLERDRETNHLVAGLQKMLAPLLGRGESAAQ